jgi:hypothetical protein
VFVWALAAQTPADWDIVPGKRVGPLIGAATRGDLARLFPQSKIEDDEIELDEGMLQPATLVDKGDPSRTLAITWNRAHPKQVFVCWGLRRGACRWQVSGGIQFGTRLSELEARNGRPFTIAGFGFGYGGNVLSWNGGKLAGLDCGGRVILTLDGERSGGRYSLAMTGEELRSIRGDRPIPSSTPAMRKLDPRVVGILFQFRGPDTPSCN